MIFIKASIMPTSLKGRSRAGSVSSEYTHIPPEYIHRSIPSTNDFPFPAGPTYPVSKRDQGLVSPAQSSFSFADNDSPVHAISTPPSPAPSATPVMISQNPAEDLLMANSMDRGTSADGLADPTPRGPQEMEPGQKRYQNYNDIFGEGHDKLSPREQVARESVITVEVKTNVIVTDEFLFLDEFSDHLAQRYQRPTSSIFITLDHSACFLFAGSYESAYIVTINALPSQLLPATNKRNTALIQSHLASSLGVLPERGVIRYCAFPEEYLATAGTTYLGQIERRQKAQTENDPPSTPQQNEVPPTAPVEDMVGKPRTEPRAIKTKGSRKSLNIHPPPTTVAQRLVKSTPGSRITSPTTKSPVPTIPWDTNNASDTVRDKKVERVQKLGKRKSFFAFFGK